MKLYLSLISCLKYFSVILFSNLFILISSCDSELIETSGGKHRNKKTKTIIVYLGGDNDLSTEINEKIEALTRGFLKTDRSSQHQLLIYLDEKNENPKLIEIDYSDPFHFQTIKTYIEHNSASGEVIKVVINDALAHSQGEEVGLIFFSHATSWLSKDQEFLATRSLAIDQNDKLLLNDFAVNLPLPKSKKWAFILFESCYMASIEVAYELRAKTETIIASAAEILSPGMNEIYPSALQFLYDTPLNTIAFAESYFERWNQKQSDYQSATISVIKTQELDRLASLSHQTFNQLTFDEKDISSLQSFNRDPTPLFFDLKEALTLFNPESILSIDQLWSRMIPYAAATQRFLPNMPYGFNIHTHSGLTTYLPMAHLKEMNKIHETTSWNKIVFQ